MAARLAAGAAWNPIAEWVATAKSPLCLDVLWKTWNADAKAGIDWNLRAKKAEGKKLPSESAGLWFGVRGLGEGF